MGMRIEAPHDVQENALGKSQYEGEIRKFVIDQL